MWTYVDPPESAVVLCVDEKSQIQALARSQPAFPMMPGMPEKRVQALERDIRAWIAAWNDRAPALLTCGPANWADGNSVTRR